MARKWASLRLSTAPAVEAVTGSDMVTHLNLPSSADSTVLGNMAKAAREVAEKYLGRAFINQSWTMYLDRAPGPILELPYAPLSSVTSLSSYDRADTETAATVTDVLFVDVAAEPGRVMLQEGASWPANTRPWNLYKLIYVSGYGAAATSVPQQILEGIKQIAAYMYEHRGDCDAESALLASGAAQNLETLRIHTL